MKRNPGIVKVAPQTWIHFVILPGKVIELRGPSYADVNRQLQDLICQLKTDAAGPASSGQK